MLPLLGIVAAIVIVLGVPMFIIALTNMLVFAPVSAIERAQSDDGQSSSGGLAKLANIVFLFFILIAPFIDGKADGWSTTYLGRFQSFIKINVLNCWPTYYDATKGFGNQRNDISYIILNWLSFVISGAIVSICIAIALVMVSTLIGSFKSRRN